MDAPFGTPGIQIKFRVENYGGQSCTVVAGKELCNKALLVDFEVHNAFGALLLGV